VGRGRHAIGQLLGSVAVFATLAYLSIQVSHARDELRRSIRQGRGEALGDLYLFRATERSLFARASAALGTPPIPFSRRWSRRRPAGGARPLNRHRPQTGGLFCPTKSSRARRHTTGPFVRSFSPAVKKTRE